ncbi:hypothetical protein [Leifsonia sp. NPDC058230]|uniref:hypothetical protein n=1 Tax=Leifsonia sp. NPDC058230 TaxID=3346391 RepID=UPI0036D809B0
MRFVSVRQKTVVVVVLLAVNGVLWLVLDPLGWVPGAIILSSLQLVGWYLASRVFRGQGEPLRPARPWWRMTARPLLSGVWAALYLAGLIASIVALPFVAVTAADVVSLVVQATLALLFGLSFVRLRRRERQQHDEQHEHGRAPTEPRQTLRA